MNDSVITSELFPANYQVFRCDRKHGRGGGTLIAVKDIHSVENMRCDTPLAQIELVCTKIYLKYKYITIVVLYIPPSLSANYYMQLFEYLDSNVDFAEPVLIAGDFNISELEACLSGNKTTELFNIYNHFLSLNGLTQQNHIYNDNMRTLDLLLTNNNVDLVLTRETLPLVTEDKHHPCLNVQVKIPNEEDVPFRNESVPKFNFRKANIHNLYTAIAEVDWSILYDIKDVPSACDRFYTVLNELFIQHVPVSNHVRNSEYPLWYTPKIIGLVKEKQKHWNKYRKTRAQFHKDRTKQLRNAIRYEVRTEYDRFVSDAEKSIKQDPKKFWLFVNNKKRSSRLPGRMKYEDESLSTPQEIVNAFARRFAAVFSSESDGHVCDNSCKNCEYCDKACCRNCSDYSTGECRSNLPSFLVNCDDIVEASKRMKCNFVSGPDSIPAFFVVDCVSCLSSPLKYLFNLILKTTVYPECWKQSRICPVLKKGDKTDVANYRPIALLSNFAKIFEIILSSVIYSQISCDIAVEQHGFVRGRSTVTNLCEYTEFVSGALDRRLQVDVVYTDLSNAFDKVNHCILIQKLQSFGLCDNLLKLMKSIIIGRSLYVEHGGHFSPVFHAESGVGQGSNLGPLLFVIFFNDVVNDMMSNKYIFADDLKLAKVIETYSDCLDLQTDVDNLEMWCQNNKLTLNIDKCRIMSYSRKENNVNFFYNISGAVVTRCTEIVDLGVTMDSVLSFVPHIVKVTNSALKILGFIIRNSKDIKDVNCIKLLFYTLVRPKLEYCNVIWYPYQQVHINLIENVLRKYCKFIYYKEFGYYPARQCDQETLLIAVNETSITSRSKTSSLIFLQNIINSRICSATLLDQIRLNIPRLSSRSVILFHYDIPHTQHHHNSPMHTCFRLHNCLPANDFDIFIDNFSSKNMKSKLCNFFAHQSFR